MAINITDQPEDWTPVYNDMRFVIASTNTTQPNFRYVADVYVSGVAGSTRLTFDANPITGYGVVDISAIIKSYISSDFNTSVYGFQRCTNSYKAYEVEFGEQYGTTVTTYPNVTSTGVKYAWNASLSAELLQSYTSSTYLVSSGVLLTNQPERQKFTSDEDQRWLYFINDTSGSAYYLKCTTFDSAGSTIGTYLIENPYQASTSINLDKLLRVGVGVHDLNNSTLASGSQPVIDSSVESYEVQIVNYAQNNGTSSYFFDRECQAREQDPINVYFLNELGGYDMYPFKYRRSLSNNIERTFIEQNHGKLTDSLWNQNTTNRGKKQIYTSITNTLNVTSDFINNYETAKWIGELVASPDVYYYETVSNIYIPLICTVNNYESKYRNWDGMWELKLTFEYANKKVRQNG